MILIGVFACVLIIDVQNSLFNPKILRNEIELAIIKLKYRNSESA
jgi:hypothetical protein